MNHPFKPLFWKRFRDDVIALWIPSHEDTNHYLYYLNTIDASGKPTNRLTYVNPKTCYRSKNINEIPEGIALTLRRIFDSDEKYEK